MNDDTEGMLIANMCLLQALFGTLILKRILSPDEVSALVGEAEGFLAGLSPTLMTPGAREFARNAVQQMSKIFPPQGG